MLFRSTCALSGREFLLDHLQSKDQIGEWFREEVLARIAQAMYEEQTVADFQSRSILADHHFVTDMPILVQLQLMIERFSASILEGRVMVVEDTTEMLQEVTLETDYRCPSFASVSFKGNKSSDDEC